MEDGIRNYYQSKSETMTQYWMKIISREQLGQLMNDPHISGMAWKPIENVWEHHPTKTYLKDSAYLKISKGDKMLFKITNSHRMYKAEVERIDWRPIANREIEIKDANEPWVHRFYFTDITSIGRIDLWANKQELEFLRPFTNPGLPFKTSMWKLSKSDFDTIVKNFH